MRPMPPDYAPKKGDVIVLHGKVKHDFRHSSGQIYVDVEGHYNTLSLSHENIVGIHSLAFEEGDAVMVDESGGPFPIIAIRDNGHVWLDTGTATGEIVDVTRLTRQAPPAEPEEPAALPPPANVESERVPA